MKPVIRVAVNGCDGRMGTCVHELALRDDQFETAALLSRDGAAWCSDERAVDAVIDFSNDVGARDACAFAVDHQASLLVATTALSDETRAAIDTAASAVPVIIAANTSFGVAVVDNLITVATQLLGARFDVSIVETHHVRKRDRPSGTALRLAESIADVTGENVAASSIHAIRTGDVVGRHEVIFGSDEQIIRISHEALSRDVFARGALHAIAWLVAQQPGMYSIRQAWGLD